MSKKGMKYDYKEAYNKNLKPSARLHYLENARHDKDSAAKFVDPMMASVGIEPQMTFQPPMPSNQMGTAKPVFSPQTQGMAQTVYGTPEQRQISVNTPYMMKSIPEGDKGAGLRALPDNVVENMGYDAATKMVSPLNDNHPGDKKMLRRAASVLTEGLSETGAGVGIKAKAKPKKMSKKLTEKPKVPVVETTKQAFGVTLDGKKVNLGKITSTEIPEKDFKQR